MNKQILKNGLSWGLLLWLFGYVLGIILSYMFVPISLVGWVIMPFGTAITLWVLIKKIKTGSLRHYMTLAVIWTLIAIVFDYLFLVKMFNPPDGYYKLDVYLYYVLTFALPVLVGWRKNK